MYVANESGVRAADHLNPDRRNFSDNNPAGWSDRRNLRYDGSEHKLARPTRSNRPSEQGRYGLRQVK
jgi:hypothetical protein